MTRRLENQFAATACNERPWRGFDYVSESVAGAAPLHAFVHAGDAGKPVIFVVHGLFDSNSNRYVRTIASALADDGFGVIVPDMRWHGCLIGMPSSLGIDESADLAAWSRAMTAKPPFAHRKAGMLGVSLGALDAIDAAARDDAAAAFPAGVIALDPPAAIAHIRDALDQPLLARHRDSSTLLTGAFRFFLAVRNRRSGIPFWSRRPFFRYLDRAAREHAPPFPPDADALTAAAEPVHDRLAAVRRPLLIISAKNDPILTPLATEALTTAAAGLTYVHVVATDGGGHVGIIARDPQWFADAMKNFFSNAERVP